MPVIEINPIDTLFFRDGKPFEMGEDNWAEGVFPPHPSTLYGAIRSAYFTSNPSQIDLANTSKDPTKELRIRGLWIKKGRTLYCSSPLDYVVEKGGDDKLLPLQLIDNHIEKLAVGTVDSHYPYQYIPFYNGDGESSSGWLVDSLSLLDYDPKDHLYGEKLEQFRQTEAKIGVGLDKSTRSNRKGNLYRVGLNRLNEGFDEEELSFKDRISFVLDYEMDFVPKIIKLGAEGKTAICSLFQGTLPNHKTITDAVTKFFRLVFLTPTVLETGWELNLNKYLQGQIKLDLVCAFVGRPLAIGGWDIKGGNDGKGIPKPMQRAIPPGSTFYFQITSGEGYKNAASELAKTHAIVDNEQMQKEGFGLFAITPLDINSLITTL